MLNYEYPPLGGGASPITQALAEHLAQARHDVDVVTMSYRSLPWYEDHGRLRVHRVPCLRRSQIRAITIEMLSYLPATVIRSLVLHQRQAYDLIHAHFIIPSSIAAMPLKYLYGLPVVITTHGSDVPGYNPDRFKRGHVVLAPLWQFLVQSASAIISPSVYLCNLLGRSCNVPVDVIPYGFDPPRIPERPRQKRILAASRLFPRKGIQYLFEALAGLDLNGWEVVVAGDGPMLAELQDQARRLSLPVQFPGFVTGEPLQTLYATSEIFVFPSLRDNFPVVLLEAVTAGCAVITTNISGMPEVVGDAGLLVPPGDAIALRNAVQRLMVDTDLRKELQQRTQRQIAYFAWPRILAEHERLYERVLEKRKRYRG